jgi:hypothetical protein
LEIGDLFYQPHRSSTALHRRTVENSLNRTGHPDANAAHQLLLTVVEALADCDNQSIAFKRYRRTLLRPYHPPRLYLRINIHSYGSFSAAATSVQRDDMGRNTEERDNGCIIRRGWWQRCARGGCVVTQQQHVDQGTKLWMAPTEDNHAAAHVGACCGVAGDNSMQ